MKGVLLVVFLALSCEACITRLPFDTLVNSTVEASSCLYRFEFESEVRLFEVELRSVASQGIQLLVLDSYFSALATVEVSTDSLNQLSLCRHPSEKVFYIRVVGDPSRSFTLMVRRLFGSRLRLGEPKTVVLGDEGKAHFFWLDNVTYLEGVPLAFRVASDRNSSEYTLHVSSNQCPSIDSLGSLEQGNQLSFISQGRLVLLPQQLAEGDVYYVGLAGRGGPLRVKNVTITVAYSASLTSDSSTLMWGLAAGILSLGVVIALVACVLLCVAAVKVTYTAPHDVDRRKALTQSNATRQRAKIYLWVVVVAAVFFWIPAIQNSNAVSNEMWLTGNRDLCYYNDLCQVPVQASGPYGFSWLSFNNVVSNAGYCMVGILLFSYVTYLQKRHKRRDTVAKVLSLPEDYTLIYALATTIFVEGLNSAVYHLCPSRTVFQVDTAFMFVGGLVVVLELYRKWFKQLPHPVFPLALMCALLMFNFFGTLLDLQTRSYPAGFGISWAVAFSVLWMLAVFAVVARHRKHMSTLPLAIITVVSSLVGCVPLLTLLEYFATTDRATMLLAVVLLQVVFTLLAYIFGTFFRHSLSVKVVRVVFFILVCGCWAGAIYFFNHSPSNKNLTPAMSRELNAACVVGDFYDAHDVWHALSSVGLGLLAFLLLHAGEDSVARIYSHHLPSFGRRTKSTDDEEVTSLINQHHSDLF